MTTPAADGFFMPAEWQAHTRCWMGWPNREHTWSPNLAAAREAHVAVARAISEFEPVTMVVDPALAVEAAAALGPNVEIVQLPVHDGWLRDTGPTFLVDGRGGLAMVDWGFNAWGGNYPEVETDAALRGRIAERFGFKRYQAPLILEGGAIAVDGEGTVLTTEECLLNPNRNPHLGRAEIEQHLRDYLGVSTVIWLPRGYDQDETDGHIDEIACFVKPGQVLHLDCDDPADPNYAIFKDNIARLRATKDARGRNLEVATVKQPVSYRERDGVRQTLSYMNFYIANGGIVMPAFGEPEDTAAYYTLSNLFPDRKIVQVAASDIVWGGGGIHCITQQQPAV